MPFYPTIQSIRTDTDAVDVFMGYNHNLRIGDGEFYDMKNMTGSFYPVLSPRGKRGVYASPTAASGLISKDALCYVDGADFVINGYHVQMGLSTTDVPKRLISMGAYVIILPDKKYVNTKDLTEFGSIEASSVTQGDVTFTLCRIDGSEYNTPTVSPAPPASPSNQDLWIDTSNEPHVLKQWSESAGVWVSIATTYVKISADGIGTPFGQYDGVTISGITVEQITDLNGTVTVWERGDDYIVVTGIIDAVQTQSTAVTVERRMPNMDFVIENENRLWGCRYGLSRDGEVVNEIYASKLGDFRNWNSFMGISTDSYVVSVGSDGVFTGAVSHLGYPLFFKENCMHKVYGSYPAQYQVNTTACRGVQRGSHESLAIVNEILYYKGRNAVCAYDGSLPVEISTALGEERYSDAVAGSNHNNYYISMKDSTDVWHLFVYDTSRRFWHREDNTHAAAFCSCDGEMYYIDAADGKIKTELGSGTPESEDVEWMAETGDLTLQMPEQKYITRIIIRMAVAAGAKVSMYVRYDSLGKWESVFTMIGKSLRSFSIPFLPRRCDHFRLRFVGKGDAKLYSMLRNLETGSDEDVF